MIYEMVIVVFFGRDLPVELGLDHPHPTHCTICISGGVSLIYNQK